MFGACLGDFALHGPRFGGKIFIVIFNAKNANN